MKRSAWWFLLPLFLGILGSAIAWSKIRDSEDHELIKWIMIFGAVQTIAFSLVSLYDPMGFNEGYMMIEPEYMMDFETDMMMEP